MRQYKGRNPAAEDMKIRLNYYFFGKEEDRAFYKMKYGAGLQFVSSLAEFAFFISGFGEHTCFGAIFIHSHRRFRANAFMDLVWDVAVKLADGEQLCASPIRKHKLTSGFTESSAVIHRGTIFIYANSCVFFTSPISSFMDP